jgi:glutathione-regulated potassium-efflux system protein KefB
MAAEQGSDLLSVVTVLAAGVVAVPVFRWLGLGSVLGYLAAGLAIGPFGLAVFGDPQAVLHVAELGVVMFLFIIGLEMQPSRLWGMRGDIFGWGLTQVAVCGALLTGSGVDGRTVLAGGVRRWHGLRAVLDRHRHADPGRAWRDQRAGRPADRLHPVAGRPRHRAAAGGGCAAGTRVPRRRQDNRNGSRSASPWPAIVGLIAISRWLLTPFFSLLAKAHAREVMTAAALLVVLGAALAMQARRPFDGHGCLRRRRHALRKHVPAAARADIEPFRGILLGLFFIGSACRWMSPWWGGTGR